VREWEALSKAPGDDVVRLRAVRVRSEVGEVVDHVDIREGVGIELEYDVLQPGFILHPHFGLRNDDGVQLFTAQDVDPEWRGRRRPVGRYVSTGWIPGNLLAEGGMSVGAHIMTLEPETPHVNMEDAVLFRVVDALDAHDTARGDYPRPIPGVMRPLLRWTTGVCELDREVAAIG
jgi:lipopolysaccharide transport system ATP-binding protein